MSDKATNRLFRYTSFASALDIIANNRLTLLPPNSWQDRNDSSLLEAYRKANNFASISVLCFTTKFETSHHWHMFAPGSDGIRLEFDRSQLENDVSALEHVALRDVEYCKLKEINKDPISLRLLDWPWLKRFPYKGEAEVRLVQFDTEHNEYPKIQISENTLKKLTLSPNLPENLQQNFIDIVKDIRGKSFRVRKSTMTLNQSWVAPVVEQANRIDQICLEGEKNGRS